MEISIIIPTYQEENSIGVLIDHLFKYGNKNLKEIIVADGGSSDQTCEIAKLRGADCFTSEKKGRGAQLHAGAERASADLLYFVHADAFPPISYCKDIEQAIFEGFEAGCYRFRFDSDRLILRLNSYFTRFDRLMCRGGDQTLFITRSLYDELGGFREDFIIMEDYDLIQKIQAESNLKIIPKDVVVSARKHEDNNYLKVNFANFVIFMMYFAGARQQTMVSAYKSMLVHPKY